MNGSKALDVVSASEINWNGKLLKNDFKGNSYFHESWKEISMCEV